MDRSDKKTYLEWLFVRYEEITHFQLVCLGTPLYDKLARFLALEKSNITYEMDQVQSLPLNVQRERYGIGESKSHKCAHLRLTWTVRLTSAVLSQNEYCQHEREVWDIAREGVILGEIDSFVGDIKILKSADRPLVAFRITHPEARGGKRWDDQFGG
jgi:hypothetical protein